MSNKATVDTIAAIADQAVSLVDDAAGYLSVAEQSMCDLHGLFEAIRCASQADTLIHRLADFGARRAQIDADTFGGHKRDYNAHTESLLAAQHSAEARP